ncbi:copper resistance CopC/CopD family protein [Mesorhizobium sp. 1B3]|uniref:copper resistance CopC/CopD family protein n=1 Tax=Mesorhizobium sp. 1B3 TaxID=3243599 RepID=UPI003D96575B
MMAFGRAISLIMAMRAMMLAGLAWLCLTTGAAAHASLVATRPSDGAVVDAPPALFTLSFSEPVSPLALRLVKPDGSASILDSFRLRDREVEIEMPGTLDRGTHVLSWRVVSEDGHPVGGSVVFSVGETSASPLKSVEPGNRDVRTGLWSSRVALYLGLFFGVGGVFAFHWLLGGEQAGRNLVAGALALGVGGTIASAGFQGLDALGVPLSSSFDPSVWRSGLETSYGRTVIVMMIALAAATAALMPEAKILGRSLSLGGLLGGAAALSLSGHAGAAEPQWLTRPSVFVHAATIAFWAGALMPLGISLRSGGPGGAAALRRFSAVIPYAVCALATAGVILAVIQVEEPRALVETAYGKLLLVKLVLVSILLLLAAINRWKFTAPSEAGEPAAVRRLVRSIAVESLVILTICAVAAGWRFTPPPRAIAIASAQPASTHIHAAKAMADVEITPGRIGPVTASAAIMTGDFGLLDAKEVTFVFSNPGAGVEPIRRKAAKATDGSWRVTDLVLPLPGTWKIRLDILISDFEMTRIEGEIVVSP